MDLVFGPVPSRRLGRSLGIDPVPLKTCSWNCVYCQLGRSGHLTRERDRFVPEEQVIDAVREALGRVGEAAIDWITFVGSGEPTLHSGLGRMIAGVKGLTGTPLAVITNGSLLGDPEVRRDLQPADAVLPSLAAGSEKLFRKIHRPASAGGLAAHLEGLKRFREEYRGPLWVEVMLIRGLNDTEAALTDLREALVSIRPDEVHLLLPERPPSSEWVRPPDEEGVMRATAILGAALPVVHPQDGRFDRAAYASIPEAVLAIVTRHPMREEELVRMLAGAGEEGRIHDALEALSKRGEIQPVVRQGQRFWGPPGGRY
jgi:wyosine [tRNA(Phe)-imidazoG37] synthetase (radical SAM superfamily)